MTTRSVIVLSTCNKTAKEINEFFGRKNVLSIKNPKKESLKNNENSFLKMFKPVVKTYSDRALLVKPTKNKKMVTSHSWVIVDGSPFVKPLYWNKSLGGWITSKQNKEALLGEKTKTSSKSSKKSLVERINKRRQCSKSKQTQKGFMELFEPEVEQYSSRSLLVKPTKNKSKSKSHLIVDKEPFVKPLYWNKSLGGWITSISNKDLFDLEESSDEFSSLDEFKELFNPSIEQYSERSLLLKPSGKTTKKKLKEIKQDWAILNFDELAKPLYWNDTLEGWVSSRDNESVLSGKKSVIKVDYSYLTTISKSEKKELADYIVEKYKRGLLMKSKKKQKSPEKYFHNGYWNETLGGWVYSKKEKNNLVSKGAVLV